MFGEQVFSLRPLLSTEDQEIRLCAQSSVGRHQILALVIGNGQLILYYIVSDRELPVIKDLHWHLEPTQQICCLSFDPSGTWLAVSSCDSSLCVVPALALVDPEAAVDLRWQTSNLTKLQTTKLRPVATSIVWWNSLDGQHVAILGSENGQVAFVSLTTGTELGRTCVDGEISNLHLSHDNSLDLVFLIISGPVRQWRLILEQRSVGFCWPLEHMEGDGLMPIPVRTRLQNLKHLSVDKMASLKQMLVENKRGGTSSVKRAAEELGGKEISTVPLALQGPEIYSPQYSKERYLISTYNPSTQLMKIYPAGLGDEKILYVHKLPSEGKPLLYADRFILLFNDDTSSLIISSSQLSEVKFDLDQSTDSVVQRFDLSTGENVIAIHKKLRSTIVDGNGPPLGQENPNSDCFIVITSRNVIEVGPKKPPSELFMLMALDSGQLESAEKLAVLFGLNMQNLLEAAADQRLEERQFSHAITLYKLSKCRYLKSALKFAKCGHPSELLSYIQILLSARDTELSLSEKLHLSNLAMMSFAEQILRQSAQEGSLLFNKYLSFLKCNLFYDEVLAVNIAGQTKTWKVLQFLAKNRGLYPEVLDILLKVKSREFWNCLSDPEMLQPLLLNNKRAKLHMQLVTAHLPCLELDVLQKLSALYNPYSPKFKSLLDAAYQQKMYKNSGALSYNKGNTQVQEFVEMFIVVMLQLMKNKSSPYLNNLVKLFKPESNIKSNKMVVPKSGHTILSAGFSHAGHVRGKQLYMWGNGVHGSLGCGPTMIKYMTPKALDLFPALGIQIFSISCGKNHSLALTSNGVYSWGSSQFGQLGVGPTCHSSHPRLVEALSDEQIIQVSAGQYHSLALSKSGRVFSWGWGVHGQLGHRSTDDQSLPTLVTSLTDKVIVQVCGAHGHSVVLTEEGEVWAFGSGAFGQLGVPNLPKSSVPLQILLPERIRLIACGYFHCLAVSATEKLYTWGSSYQALRLHAQAQKRARIVQEKQFVSESAQEDETAVHPPQFSPSLIDTSQVQGSIVQISCGFHHSLLLDSNSEVYSWGRGIDGQLGQMNRKEISAPLALHSLTGRNIVAIDAGSDFSLAVDKSGVLISWGSNAYSQLGSIPQEPKKSFEGKLVKYKNMKRVIKLPSGRQSIVETPTEVLSFPQMLINSDDEETDQQECAPVWNTKELPFDAEGLHFVLEVLQDLYDPTKILSKCLEAENYQAAAKVAALQKNYAAALTYQLHALGKGGNSHCSSLLSLDSPQGAIYCFTVEGGSEQRADEGQEMPKESMAGEASHIVEHYVNFIESESHGVIKKLLEQGIDFWLNHSLPMGHLEELFMKHISKFSMPLGLMLFCSTKEDSQLWSQLSTSFCLQLCKDILAGMNEKKVIPEYVELLSQVTSIHSSERTEAESWQRDPHSLMDSVPDRGTFMTLNEGPSSQSEEQLIFTCGHRYGLDTFHRSLLPEIELALLRLNQPLPTTASILRELFSLNPLVKLACPMCVLSHLQESTS
ncbi:uncharacterized protein LOC132195443 isoform X2 [Neocloeon triangulifer]|uniref:uncharacterized protein LOC132195443 isoform X2 n=1 Tax=Neocloeon triangulifer TaxID=2078957 RepID=UPI00286EE188|nr:uncharacterized protein LOC132195443 isoform X2 [Neocloeon triangulifer]